MPKDKENLDNYIKDILADELDRQRGNLGLYVDPDKGKKGIETHTAYIIAQTMSAPPTQYSPLYPAVDGLKIDPKNLVPAHLEELGFSNNRKILVDAIVDATRVRMDYDDKKYPTPKDRNYAFFDISHNYKDDPNWVNIQPDGKKVNLGRYHDEGNKTSDDDVTVDAKEILLALKRLQEQGLKLTEKQLRKAIETGGLKLSKGAEEIIQGAYYTPSVPKQDVKGL